MTIKQFQNVNGYTESAASVKADFLRTGRKVLKAVGKALVARGFTEQDIRTNAAGVAVSGDVYADYFRPGEPIGVWIEWTQSCVGAGGTTIMYRWTERREQGKHTDTGPNQWLAVNGAVDIDKLADSAAKQAKLRPAFTGKIC